MDIEDSWSKEEQFSLVDRVVWSPETPLENDRYYVRYHDKNMSNTLLLREIEVIRRGDDKVVHRQKIYLYARGK